MATWSQLKYVVAYDPRRHQGMTLRRRRSRHPRASSPLDRRRRRMPSFTIPSEDLISPRHISQGLHARGVIFPVFSLLWTYLARTCLSGPLHLFFLPFYAVRWVLSISGSHSWGHFPLWTFKFLWVCFRCGLWASSGPFPLSAHYGLYKRGRDPPTNPSRHLKKKKEHPSSQVAAQGRARRETNRRHRRRSTTCRREAAASPCLAH